VRLRRRTRRGDELAEEAEEEEVEQVHGGETDDALAFHVSTATHCKWREVRDPSPRAMHPSKLSRPCSKYSVYNYCSILCNYFVTA
jgi:hypothetical protein